MIASVSAKPSHWMLVISSRISGWRVTASITLPKMIPMPTPAPTAPRPPPTAIPKPFVIPEEAAAVMMCKPSIRDSFSLVVRDRAAHVDCGEGRENERLQCGHQAQLEQVDEDPGQERDPPERLEPEDHREPARHEQDDHVPGEDVRPQPDG